MKSSGIGGQAVVNGVLIRHRSDISIAVRRRNGEISITKDKFSSISEKSAIFRAPFIRGIVAFLDWARLGVKYTGKSAEIFDNDRKEEAFSFVNVLVLLGAIILSIACFFVLPSFFSDVCRAYISKPILLGTIEVFSRIIFFVLFILFASLNRGIRICFMNISAQHMVSNCIDYGKKLTVKNVKRMPREAEKCATTYTLMAILISDIAMTFINFRLLWLRLLLRILVFPVVQGLLYEIMYAAIKSNNNALKLLLTPGLLIQRLITREPEDEMLEVAIAGVEAVFDWESFLLERKRFAARRRRLEEHRRKAIEEETRIMQGEGDSPLDLEGEDSDEDLDEIEVKEVLSDETESEENKEIVEEKKASEDSIEKASTSDDKDSEDNSSEESPKSDTLPRTQSTKRKKKRKKSQRKSKDTNSTLEQSEILKTEDKVVSVAEPEDKSEGAAEVSTKNIDKDSSLKSESAPVEDDIKKPTESDNTESTIPSVPEKSVDTEEIMDEESLKRKYDEELGFTDKKEEKKVRPIDEIKISKEISSGTASEKPERKRKKGGFFKRDQEALKRREEREKLRKEQREAARRERERFGNNMKDMEKDLEKWLSEHEDD